MKSSPRILIAVATGLFGLSLAGCGQRLAIDGVDAQAYGGSDAMTATAFEMNQEHARESGETTANFNTLNRDVILLIRVKSALTSTPGLKALPIDVGVLRGVVTLYGEVDTLEHRKRAERIARNVPGVEAVQSEIAVNRGAL